MTLKWSLIPFGIGKGFRDLARKGRLKEVICTDGGPTDEFANGPLVRRVRSARKEVELEAGVAGEYVEPDLDDLVFAMRAASRNRDRRSALASEAARLAHRDFSWSKSADRLVDVFSNASA